MQKRNTGAQIEPKVSGLVHKHSFNEEKAAKLDTDRFSKAALAAREDDFPQMLDELAAAAADGGIVADGGRKLPEMSSTAVFDNGDLFAEPKFRKLNVGPTSVLGPVMGFSGLDSAFDSSFLHRGSGFGDSLEGVDGEAYNMYDDPRFRKAPKAPTQGTQSSAPPPSSPRDYEAVAMDMATEAFAELSDPLWQKAMLDLGSTGKNGTGSSGSSGSSSRADASFSLRAEPAATEPIPSGQNIRVSLGAGLATDSSPSANEATGGIFVPFLLPDPYPGTIKYSVLAPANTMVLTKAQQQQQQLLQQKVKQKQNHKQTQKKHAQPRLVRAVNEALQAIGAHTLAFKASKCKWKCVAYPECQELIFKVAVWRQGRRGTRQSRDAADSPPLLVELQHRYGCGFAFCSYFDRLEEELLVRGVLCDKRGQRREPAAMPAASSSSGGGGGGGGCDRSCGREGERREESGARHRRPLSARNLDCSLVSAEVSEDDIAPILRMASCEFADVQCDGARAMFSIANGPLPLHSILSKDVTYDDVKDDGVEEAALGDGFAKPKLRRSKSCISAMYEMVNSEDVSVARCAVTAVATLCEHGDEQGRQAVLCAGENFSEQLRSKTKGAGGHRDAAANNAFVRALLDFVLGRNPATAAPVAHLREHVSKQGKSTKTTAEAATCPPGRATCCAETRRQALRALCALASSRGSSGAATVAALKALGRELELNVAETFKNVDAEQDHIAGRYARQLSELVC